MTEKRFLGKLEMTDSVFRMTGYVISNGINTTVISGEASEITPLVISSEAQRNREIFTINDVQSLRQRKSVALKESLGYARDDRGGSG